MLYCHVLLVLLQAWDVDWYFTSYSDIQTEITKSDLDRLKEKKKQDEKSNENGDKKDDENNSGDACGDKQKQYSALVLAFSLPTSS